MNLQNIDIYMLNSDITARLRTEYEADSTNQVMENIVSRNSLQRLAVNRRLDGVNRNTFSVRPKPHVKVTNQKSSGRCWAFAGLNVLRRELIKRYNLPPDFELSQSYFFFWDKFERFNYNMERIIATAAEPLDGRLVQCLLSDPLCDGGQWAMFTNLVERHGVVPKSVYGESRHTSNSGEINAVLKRLFRECTLLVRSELSLGSEPAAVERARDIKTRYLSRVFKVLCRSFGMPPEQFRWQYTDTEGKVHTRRQVTPTEFFKRYVKVDFGDYCCLTNDPRHDYYQRYRVEHLGNVEGGREVVYLNVPIEVLKTAVRSSLEGGQAVWFGCDVGQHLAGVVMDDQSFETGKLFDIDFTMDKVARIRSGESLMTHAMVFSGCNVDEQGRVDRYQVENSWGTGKSESDDRTDTAGYYLMSDSWFTEYMYEIVVHKRFVDHRVVKALAEATVATLPLWDPMGSLAGGACCPPIAPPATGIGLCKNNLCSLCPSSSELWTQNCGFTVGGSMTSTKRRGLWGAKQKYLGSPNEQLVTKYQRRKMLCIPEISERVYSIFASYLDNPEALEELKNQVSNERDYYDLVDLVQRMQEPYRSNLKSLFWQNQVNPDGPYAVKMMVDIDNTTLENSTTGPIVYRDKQLVPGITSFLYLLSGGGRSSTAFLSARPAVIERHSIDTVNGQLNHRLRFSFLTGTVKPIIRYLAGKCIQSRETVEQSYIEMGREKFSNYLDLKEVYPHARFVFLGDDTQGDPYLAYNMVQQSPDNWAAIRVVTGREFPLAITGHPRIYWHRGYFELAYQLAEARLIDRGQIASLLSSEMQTGYHPEQYDPSQVARDRHYLNLLVS